jgi:acetyl-CoA acetyltransferase
MAQSALARRAFIAGGAHTSFIGKGHPDFVWKGHPDFGKRDNPTFEDDLKEAVEGCLDDTGADPAAIDRLYLGNFVGELFVKQGHLGAALVGSHPAFEGKPSARLEGACASGGLAVLAGLDAIAAGADIVLVAGVEIQTTESARTGADYLARAAHYTRQRGIDEFTFPALFARRTKAYRDRFGVSEEDIARVSVKAYANANKNPKAHMHAKEMPLELAREASERNPAFLGNEELKPYLKVSDCSQVSDGASCLLLVSEKGLAKLGRKEADVAEIVARGHAVSSLYKDGDPTVLTTTQKATRQALEDARIGTKDLGVMEVHDCFSVTELMMLEAVGVAAAGQGAALTRDGTTAIDGSLPVNTGGGLIGFGHPVGATGVKQALEIFRQMKGRCGDYQIAEPPQWGLTANMGGDDKTVVSLAIRNGA